MGISRFVMTMDSLLVVSQLKGVWACQSPHLQVLLRQARLLADGFDSFMIFHSYREDNSTADALCNFAFDNLVPGVGGWNHAIAHLDWTHDLHLTQYKLSKAGLHRNWEEVWMLVQRELRAIGPMIRDQWSTPIPSFVSPHNPVTEITVISTIEPHDTSTLSWPYVFGPEGLVEMKKLVADSGLPWDPSRFHKLEGNVNLHGVTIYEYPTLDAAYATLILSRIDWNLERLIHAWRGQTVDDMRPNKKLSFERLEGATGGYDNQDALKSLIESGYQLHWKSPFVGPRPLPKNHLSAELHHEIMGAQILKHYHSGRLLMLDADVVAAHVPGFTTSPYACVPKAHKPLTHACRPIHDQSSPDKLSVNDNLDPEGRPNAQWPASREIADRMLFATAQYGTSALYGFNTDIADAFLNIGLHASDVPINGGLLPASNLAALATTAIFGNCESPGAFKILNCVSHVHGSKASVIDHVNTPFDIRFYVDDGNCIEPNIGTRLFDAESSLRAATELVFGPNCIQESKTTPWAKVFKSLGFEWNLHDGTVSIPAEKLGRVRDCLLEFSGKKSASISDFRSIVGKLRHVATVCPPAKALMHLLGLKLHSKHHINGRTHRPVTTAMRTELRWWADHLTPDTFYKLPVEWMGSQLPPVNQWIHIYSVPLTGVWLVDFANNTSCFQPWLSSLAVSLFTAIELQLSSNAAIQQRMFHTRFIVNECGMARMINSGSSSDSSLQHALKMSGLWQLQHRHRFTATSTKWENMPDLIVDPCPSHRSNFTNYLLSLQISWTTKLGEPSLPRLIHGNSPPSAKARSRHMVRTFATGSSSRFPFSFPQFFSTNCLRPTSPPSWRGSQSRAENMATMPSRKEISLAHTKSRKLPWCGPISTTGTPFSSSKVPLCLSWKPVIGELSTSLIPNSPFMLQCCPDALHNSVFGPSPKRNWRGGAFYSNSFILGEQASSGTQEDSRNTLCPRPIWKLNHDPITEFKSETSSSRTNMETSSPVIFTSQSQLQSRSTMRKRIKWDVEIQSPWENLDIDPSARSKALSWPFVDVPLGRKPTKTMLCQEESKLQELQPSSKEQLKWRGKIQQIMPFTPSELATLQCYSKSGTTSSSFDSPADGQVKLSLSILGFPVGCC